MSGMLAREGRGNSMRYENWLGKRITEDDKVTLRDEIIKQVLAKEPSRIQPLPDGETRNDEISNTEKNDGKQHLSFQDFIIDDREGVQTHTKESDQRIEEEVVEVGNHASLDDGILPLDLPNDPPSDTIEETPDQTQILSDQTQILSDPEEMVSTINLPDTQEHSDTQESDLNGNEIPIPPEMELEIPELEKKIEDGPNEELLNRMDGQKLHETWNVEEQTKTEPAFDTAELNPETAENSWNIADPNQDQAARQNKLRFAHRHDPNVQPRGSVDARKYSELQTMYTELLKQHQNLMYRFQALENENFELADEVARLEAELNERIKNEKLQQSKILEMQAEMMKIFEQTRQEMLQVLHKVGQ
jgi:hypothetical protein